MMASIALVLVPAGIIGLLGAALGVRDLQKKETGPIQPDSPKAYGQDAGKGGADAP